jgi:hypothetical protein
MLVRTLSKIAHVRPAAPDLLFKNLWWKCSLFFAMQNDAPGRVSRVPPVQTAMRNCTRDEGGPFEIGNQVLGSSHRKLLWSKAVVVSVAETAGQDPVRQG